MFLIILRVHFYMFPYLNNYAFFVYNLILFKIEEYIRQFDDDYNYEEVPVEDFYENGKYLLDLLFKYLRNVK